MTEQEQHIDFQPERKCPMQAGQMMTAKWCDLAQCKGLCRGCVYDLGREVSRYVQGKERA